MREWKECKLGDAFKVKHGFAFKGEFITENPNNNILVTPGNFHIGGGFKSDKYKYYSSDEFPKEYILSGNDIVVTMTDLSKESDTLGYSAKIPVSSKIKYLHNQRIGLLQFFNSDFDKDFIYWLLRTRDYQGYIVGSASGTSIMHTSPSRIEDYVYLFPSLPEQKAIAEVLSSLDDKIDLLHRQNKTLEAMAEALFRQWFVELCKEGLPEEWEETTISKLAEVSSGKGLKADQLNDNGIYPVFGANGEIGRTNNYLFDEKLIFTGRVGTLGNIFIINKGKVWLSDNALIIFPKKYFYSVYFMLKFAKLEEYNVGSTQPLIRQSDINEIEVYLPPETVLEIFESETENLFNKVHFNTKQIRTLEKLRNTLLPKLMSGDVKVSG
jgi:type I restriction enzyme S subunit